MKLETCNAMAEGTLGFALLVFKKIYIYNLTDDNVAISCRYIGALLCFFQEKKISKFT